MSTLCPLSVHSLSTLCPFYDHSLIHSPSTLCLFSLHFLSAFCSFSVHFMVHPLSTLCRLSGPHSVHSLSTLCPPGCGPYGGQGGSCTALESEYIKPPLDFNRHEEGEGGRDFFFCFFFFFQNRCLKSNMTGIDGGIKNKLFFFVLL